MKALILCHKVASDAGMIANMLEERGAQIDIVMGYHDKLPGIAVDAHDLVVFMGGPMGVYNRDVFPYLNSEIEFLKKRLDAKLPYLGVCLGAQLMAGALGAEVYAGKQGPEIGWCGVDVTPEGEKTPVRHFDKTRTAMIQWHGDTFDMPQGCELLASSPLYKHQAIQYGDKALGVQFHPEVTSDILEMWLTMNMKDLDKIGSDVATFRAEYQQKLPALQKQMRTFFEEWLENMRLRAKNA